jgi:hypothetical protein
VTEPRAMTDIETAWLAGLLDGEGCFDAQGTNPRVRVKMTDLDLVVRAAHSMGSTYYGDPGGLARGHRMAWVAQVTGERAAHVMRSVLPHMGARRTEKIVALLIAYDARQRPALAPVKLAA